MSQSSTYFHHEAINGCYNINEYKQKTKGCGDSTTGFLPLLLLGEIKNQKTVIIKKSKKQLKKCINWCDSEYGMDSRKIMTDMHETLCSVSGLIINQSDIDARLQEIWEYLVDDEWLTRYKAISKLNIQVDNTSIDGNAARSFYEAIQQNI
jgi:hypothetical protein